MKAMPNEGFFVIDSITRKEEGHYHALIRIKWHGNKGRSHVWGYHLTAEDEIQAYIQTVEFMHGKRERGDGINFRGCKLVQHEWRKTKPNNC